MKTKTKIIVIMLLACFIMLPSKQAQAQIPIVDIIKAGIKKVIKAVDLKIQRMQNKTIWLQNAQKTLENTLSKAKLEQISEWTEKQKEQYRKYYDELAQVKAVVSYYQRIRDITKKQLRLVREYNHYWQLLRKDGHFSPGELEYMAKVYGGILEESLKNIDQIALIAKSFATRMSDAKRLELIGAAADRVDANYDDLSRFNQQNILLSLQRARSAREIEMLKRFYGLQ